MRAVCSLVALVLLSGATAQDESFADAPAPEDDAAEPEDLELAPWSPDDSGVDPSAGLQEQLAVVHSLASKFAVKVQARKEAAQDADATQDAQASKADETDEETVASASTEDLNAADLDHKPAEGELEMFTGPQTSRIVGRLPKGLPLASLQVVQHGRLVIVIYHLGGKHTTGVEHHFVLEFEPAKPGVAQYSQAEGNFQYTVERPTPWGGGRMTTVPIDVSKDAKTTSDWVAVKTPDGKTYYYNRKSRKTTWTKPANLAALLGRKGVKASPPVKGLPSTLDMKDTKEGVEISGLLPMGLTQNSLKVLTQNRQIVINYQVALREGGTGNVGVEQRFVLKFDPLEQTKASYNADNGAFSFKIKQPEPYQKGAALHIPIKLTSKKGGPPGPPKLLLQAAARTRTVQRVA